MGELLSRILGFFQNTDTQSQALLLAGAVVALFAALRTFLAALAAVLKILAPMTETKFDDIALGLVSKCYDGVNWAYQKLAKLIDHKTAPPK